MSLPYDATTKALLTTRPADWLALLGRPPQPVKVIPADLATVSASADFVLEVGRGAKRWLLHLEMQTSRDPTLEERIRLYNALLDYRHGLPVKSVVVFLRET